MKKWELINSEIAFQSKWFRVNKDTCRLPNGHTIDDYFYASGNHFAIVFALTESEEVILVRQYKHGVKDIVTELPAGLVDEKDFAPLETILRELEEETGYKPKKIEPLTTFFVSPAKADTLAYTFFASSCVRISDQKLDEKEQIEILFAKPEELPEMIAHGDIRESNSIATIFMGLEKLRGLKENR